MQDFSYFNSLIRMDILVHDASLGRVIDLVP